MSGRRGAIQPQESTVSTEAPVHGPILGTNALQDLPSSYLPRFREGTPLYVRGALESYVPGKFVVAPNLRQRATRHASRQEGHTRFHANLPPGTSMHDIRNKSNTLQILLNRIQSGTYSKITKKSSNRTHLSTEAFRLSGVHISSEKTLADEDIYDLAVLPGPMPCTAYGIKPDLGHEKHLKQYDDLDSTWPQEKAQIEEADTERYEQVTQAIRRSNMKGLQHILQIDRARAYVASTFSALRRRKEATDALFRNVAPLQFQRTPRKQDLNSAKSQEETRDAVVPEAESVPEKSEAVNLLDSSEEDCEVVEAGIDSPGPALSGGVNLLDSTDESESDAEQEDSEMIHEDESLSLHVSARVLSDSMKEQYTRVTQDMRTSDNILTHERAHVGVTGDDLHTMAPGMWLGDSCINMYIALLQDRDRTWFEEGNTRPRCLFMNSHFLSKMCQEAGGYNYSKVQRWTAKRKLKSLKLDYYSGIEDIDKLVIPVHLGNHWVCAVLNFRDRQIEYYDSLGGVDQHTVKSLLRWVEDEYIDKYKKDLPEKYQTSSWGKVFNPDGTPFQRNGHDCGVFAIMCCNYVSADRPFDYGQQEIHSFFRAICTLECYSMSLRSIDL